MIYSERSGAVISPCGFYRYRLWRRWNLEGRVLPWLMLNPSTADAEANDPTIEAVIDFSRRWGYGGAEVLNLYAYRTKSPEVLKAAGYPVGLDNDVTLRALAQSCSTVMCAWGTKAQPERIAAVYETLCGITDLKCLRHNKDGSPKHPLYVKRDVRPMLWDPKYGYSLQEEEDLA